MPASNVLGSSIPLRRTSLLVAAVSSLAGQPSHAASFTVLGGPDTQGFATAVSDNGSVVAGWFADGGFRAFRWTEAGGIEILPSIGPARAYGISGDGRVVVGGALVPGSPNTAPVRWVGSTQPEPLQIPNVDFAGNGALGASFDGSVIAGYFGGWSEDRGIFDIGGIGYDVSGDGSIIVGETLGSTSNPGVAIRWTEASGPITIGPPPNPSYKSAARAISADGTTVVGSGAGGGSRPWRWNEVDGTTFIGNPDDPKVLPPALDVSGNGSVILSQGGGTIWIDGIGVTDLSELLTQQGIVGMGDWLLVALAVSADGRTIVGDARSTLTSPSFSRPFIARIDPVPVPAAALLLGSALTALATVRGLRALAGS